jgi:hypothetical protein
VARDAAADHARLFPDGQLAEEAAALHVEALCRLADPTAADALTTFQRRWPRSAATARLATTCQP